MPRPKKPRAEPSIPLPPLGSSLTPRSVSLSSLRSSYSSYFEAVNPTFEVARFQREVLFPALDKVLSGVIDRLMVFIPFRHGKSEAVTIAFPPFYLGHHPGESVITLSHTTPLARRFGRRCRRIFYSEAFSAAFPDCSLELDNRSAIEFHLTNGSELFYTGMEGNAQGRPANLFIIDDYCKSRKQALSPDLQERARDTYTSVVETRLEPGARIIFCNVRWTTNDLAGWRMKEDGAIDYFTGEPYVEDGKPIDCEGKENPWHILALSFRAEEDEPWGRSKGEILWPERYDEKEVKKVEAKDPLIVEAGYQQKPKIGGGRWFNRSWINYYKWRSLKLESLNRYQICDPANSKTSKSDYTANFCFGTGADQNFYWIEMTRQRLDSTERITEFIRMHRRHRPVAAGYEEYGLNCDIHHMRAVMEKQNYRFTVIPLGGRSRDHNVSKDDRMRSRLTSLGRSGRLWLPDPDDPDTPKDQADLVRLFLEHEWDLAPSSPHDDMLDVMSRMEDEELGVTFPRQEDQMPKSYNYNQSGQMPWWA